MRALIATVIIACSLSIASGEDVFVYDGKEHEWSGMAVSSSMAKAYQQYRERKAVSPLWLVHSTGYEARFTVRNGIVYLESISFRFDRGATPEEVMGVAIPPGGLEATWIDSDQIAYFGDPVFEHVRSHERVFEIRKGRLLSVHERESPLAKKLKDMMKKKGEPGATDNPGNTQ